MKILLVIPSLGNVYGGPTNIVIGWAEALAKHGVLVDIVTTNANGSEFLAVPLNKWLVEAGYRVQYFPCINYKNYIWSNCFVKWATSNLKDYDIVHSSAIFSLFNLPAYRACQFYNVPYIVAPHGMLESWALSHKAKRKKVYYELVEKQALQHAAAIQATASIESINLSKIKPRLKPPIILIPNGVHIHELELKDKTLFYQEFPHAANKLLILFLGRIDPKKGLDLLAQAFAAVHAQFPLAHLIIAGPDNINFLPTAQQYFAAAGCLEAVTFTGMLTGDLKQAALAAADVYVAPSYSEGFSMSVLEGMASGLPCVITTGCNFPEAASAQVAHVVDPIADQIGDALSRCLQDPEAAKAMGQRARQFIFDHYTWDKIARDLIQVYGAIIEKRPIPPCLLAPS